MTNMNSQVHLTPLLEASHWRTAYERHSNEAVPNSSSGDGCGKQPVLEAISNTISFADTNAPVYPRLALGSTWDQVSGSIQS